MTPFPRGAIIGGLWVLPFAVADMGFSKFGKRRALCSGRQPPDERQKHTFRGLGFSMRLHASSLKFSVSKDDLQLRTVVMTAWESLTECGGKVARSCGIWIVKRRYRFSHSLVDPVSELLLPKTLAADLWKALDDEGNACARPVRQVIKIWV
eukprot:GHVU01145542.1.p1 GENE.GHVU01145542.1~~GHVU01145542.1.p1  ORF type:complete len:152 (-),score=3.37 GHVU01145542.1:754-1209(-)